MGQHIVHLHLVFTRLREAHLMAKPSKCFLTMEECQYLKHMVGRSHVRLPRCKSNSRSEVHQACHFIPHFADIAIPPTSTIRKKWVVFWSESLQSSFDPMKKALTSEPILTGSDFNFEFQLHTDSSDIGIDAVFSQSSSEHGTRPISFYSKQLFPCQCKYSHVDKECLTLVSPYAAGFKQDYFQHFTSLFVNYETGQESTKVPSNIVYRIAQERL